MLTGKAKQDFENWYFINDSKLDNFISVEIKGDILEDVQAFYYLPESMQWGVYVDFFESLEPVPIPLDKNMMDIYYAYPGDYDKETSRKAAIEKANEIYNSK